MSAAPQPASSPAGEDADARPSVLIVDDSRFVRASMVRSLARDFRVQQADSGERAWELLLLDDSIGAVLSDLSMPGVDGFELLRRVRGSLLPRIRDLPFAVLSGGDDPLARSRAYDLGADRFDVKGAAVDELSDWLTQRLAKDVSASAGPGSASASGESAAPDRRNQQALQDWLMAVYGRMSPSVDAPAVVFRLHAQGAEDLPERLKRGIRAADALYLDSAETAWLCAAGSAAHALRLALRFGVLAAGREAAHLPLGARIEVCLQLIDPTRPLACLAALHGAVRSLPQFPGLAVRAGAGGWGPAWDCQLPWAAARLLVS